MNITSPSTAAHLLLDPDMTQHRNQTHNALQRMHQQSHPLSMESRTAVGTLLVGVGVATVGGHGCLLLTLFTHPGLASYCTCLICMLTLTDLVVVWLLVPLLGACFFHDGWPYRAGDLCTVEGFLVPLLSSVHILTLCSIAFVRYLRYCRYAVYCLVLFKFFVPINVAVIWVVSTLLASLPFMGQRDRDSGVQFVPELCLCLPTSTLYCASLIFLLFVFPSILIFSFYIKVAYKVKLLEPLVLRSVHNSFSPDLESSCFAVLLPGPPRVRKVSSWRMSCLNTCLWHYFMQRRDSFLHRAVVSALEREMWYSSRMISESLTEFLDMCCHRQNELVLQNSGLIWISPDFSHITSSHPEESQVDSSLVRAIAVREGREVTTTSASRAVAEDENIGLRKKKRFPMSPSGRSEICEILHGNRKETTKTHEETTKTREEATTKIREEMTKNREETTTKIREEMTKPREETTRIREEITRTREESPKTGDTIAFHDLPMAQNGMSLKPDTPPKKSSTFSSPPSTSKTPPRSTEFHGRSSTISYDEWSRNFPLLVHKLGDGVSRLSQTTPTFQSAGVSFLGGFCSVTRIIDFKAQDMKTREVLENLESVRKEEISILSTTLAILMSFFVPLFPVALTLGLQLMDEHVVSSWMSLTCLFLLLAHLALIPLVYGWTHLRIRRAFLAKLRRLRTRRGLSGRVGHLPPPR